MPRKLIASLGLLAGCSSPEATPADASAPADPEALGPFAVGVTSLSIDDGEGTGRTLPIEVWYPAAEGGGVAADYVLSLGVIELARIASPVGAVRDAEAASEGRRPAIVFSHGNGGVSFQSYYLTEHLASHGFVVAAPDHVGNTFEAMVNAALALPAIEMSRLRPLDVTRTLDALLEASRSDQGPLAGLVDEARVGVAGHSFGGFTAFRIAGASIDVEGYEAACSGGDGGLLCEGWSPTFEMPASQRDERFVAALPQAPGGALAFAGGGFESVAVPTMIQAAGADKTTPWEPESLAAFEELAGPAWLAVIDRAGHFTYSNMCTLVELTGLGAAAGNVFDDGCGPDNVPPPDAHRLANRYATAFFQKTLAGTSAYDELLAPARAADGLARYDAK